MALTISVPTLGEVLNTATILTVDAGDDVGGLAGPLGGAGITATIANPTIDNNGQIASVGLLDDLGVLVPGTADAVDLNLGGTVNNGTGAVIDGTSNGITVAGGAGTINNTAASSQITGATDGIAATANTVVTNVGSILGSTGSGVAMTAGGAVTNTAGTVTGAIDGISITGTLAGSPSDVTNSGGISATGPAGVGVALDLGNLTNANGGTIAAATAGGVGVTIGTGSLDNQAGAAISGALDGVEGTAVSALTNAGTITGTAGDGVAAMAGTVTNDVGGVISGALDGVSMASPGTVDNLGTITATLPGGVGVNLLNGGVVIDAGTISGSDAAGNPGGVAVDLGGTGGSRLVLDPGAVLNGVAEAAGTGNTLEVAAGAGPVTLADLGTSVTGFGTTDVDAGASLDVLGGITQPGTVSLGNGSSLTVGGPVAAGVDVDLGAGNATLTLDDPTGFAGTIANLVPGDTLDLSGLATGTTVSYAQGTGLTITTPTGATSVIPVSLPAGVSLGLTLDGLGVTVSAGGTGTSVTTGGGGTTTTGGGTSSGGNGGTTGGGTSSGGNGGTSSGGSTSTGGGASSGGAAGSGGMTVSTDPTTGATTTTVSGGGGSSSVTTDPGAGDITAISTSPLGNTISFVLPQGSDVSQGTGAAAGDLVSVDPSAAFDGRGRFTVTGHVASASGVTSVAVSAAVDDGTPTLLGNATVNADGSYSFVDKVGPHFQGFITATETDATGAQTSVQAPYSLQAGLAGTGKVAQEVQYDAAGDTVMATSNFEANGERILSVQAPSQTFHLQPDDIVQAHGHVDTSFVFDPGDGISVIHGFKLGGVGHDTLELPSSDFTNLANVLRHTGDVHGSAFITDPKTGDAIRLAGVTTAELKAHPKDIAFHA